MNTQDIKKNSAVELYRQAGLITELEENSPLPDENINTLINENTETKPLQNGERFYSIIAAF